MGQDAKLLFTGTLSFPCFSIALSPDGRTAAVASDTNIAFWDALSEKEEKVLKDVHSGNLPENVHFFSRICFILDKSGKHLQSQFVLLRAISLDTFTLESLFI